MAEFKTHPDVLSVRPKRLAFSPTGVTPEAKRTTGKLSGKRTKERQIDITVKPLFFKSVRCKSCYNIIIREKNR